MSSDESDSDEDYVASENGSVRSNSDEDDSDADGEYGTPSLERQRGKNGQDASHENDETKSREKTEDELWNEFLGGTADQKETDKGKEQSKGIQRATKDSLDEIHGPQAVSVIRPSAPSANSSETSEVFGKNGSPRDEGSQASDGRSGSEDVEPRGNQSPKPKAQASTSSVKPSGVSSLLERIGKDRKPTTLDKSRQDWESYKAKEGISEELLTHNRGKGGFLERKEFLERSDYRQFEKERDLRLSRKRKSPLD